ncbi:transglycosylase domain-containing protein [Burkholderia pseudomallei]|uniref:transglycosylase domain-containing protein n=1 Tax=Burkholderia pseudomallei TaxID=28450 RepID=UPI000978A3EA|nr:transglycosylase domain-containing protein [Burkholderia pseudomallei]ONC92708.1 glycosyl transferase family 51 [Burkholderia pseudomallei]ONC99719.1 glycosyl transferase family 51 [Burkholderia pseudomallei]OND16202.1 glycosyl transferase family 51 [Burkholderia pseudomallei]OND20845.1 glycosyl transferase family 51 [Burkholderia pseudomallei]OND22487.1 glycosyl transferase family 51 [Burkholderia pseudomallei]
MNRPLIRIALRPTGTLSFWKGFKWSLIVIVAIAVAIVARLVQIEIETSRLQARFLSELTRDVGYSVDEGASNRIRFPDNGPYDLRLGYALLPSFQQRLLSRGFVVASQARVSDRMLSLADERLFLPYGEKDQAGLSIVDSTGSPLFGVVYPHHAYVDFDTIPPLVVQSLLFIEDRYLLDPSQPNRNPAIDWGRFSRALADQGLRFVNRHQATPGGSTLATQLEKFRHSPDGRTATPPEKLRQIASASVRAYLNGPQTMAARHAIVVHYLNSVPLAARARVGEITGIGDGLAAWYGRDFDEVNRLLAAPTTPENVAAQGVAFRQVLSLMIAQRAPSFFLNRGYPALQRLTDSYLRLLSTGGVITPALRDAALAAHVERGAVPAAADTRSFVARKAVTAARAHLLGALGIDNVYQLDRLDLRATDTLNNGVQQAVAAGLARAATRDGAREAGLYGFEMLRSGDDPSKIQYSFTLYERRDGANLLRVQTDSVDQPFDINQGARLNLGSTAKLRTVVTYLQIVSELHARYANLSAAELAKVKPDPTDALSRWALDYLAHTPERSLRAMLAAAVERKYSASPGETFYTGGGAQSFTNFDKSDNGKILTVHVAFQNSVNLVFVRLMRDIVHYEMIRSSGPSSSWLDDPAQRQRYLMRFVDSESRVYVKRFYTRYAGKPDDDALAAMLGTVRKSPPRVATVLRSVAPEQPRAWFDAKMRAALHGTPAAAKLSDDALDKLYTKYAIERFNLNDRGYIAGVHPLALWTLAYLRRHPAASLDDVQKASRDARIASYSWLFKTRYHATQDRRIKRMVELRAYDAIGESWRALGYPFDHLTPSYAAAIGASGDQPAALAKLVGLIANHGEQVPNERISSLEFAHGTPYETRFVRAAAQPRPLLSPEIADQVHVLLGDVVQRGTGRRLAQGLAFPDGQTLPVYGKTGTGDQRFNVYARGARLIESRKVNRSATFAFSLGDRFFGVLTAYAHEPYAARYDFTSAMAVQLLKSLAPALQPLMAAPAQPSANTGTAPGADETNTDGASAQTAERG